MFLGQTEILGLVTVNFCQKRNPPTGPRNSLRLSSVVYVAFIVHFDRRGAAHSMA